MIVLPFLSIYTHRKSDTLPISLGSSQIFILVIYSIYRNQIKTEIRQKGIFKEKLNSWKEFEFYTWQTETEFNKINVNRLPVFYFRPSD